MKAVLLYVSDDRVLKLVSGPEKALLLKVGLVRVLTLEASSGMTNKKHVLKTCVHNHRYKKAGTPNPAHSPGLDDGDWKGWLWMPSPARG